MLEINLTTKELVERLTCDKEHGLVEIDHYRRIVELDDDYFLGLYYKDYIDLDHLDEISVNETLNFYKEYWDGVNKNNYGVTTKKRKEDLISKIEEVQEEYTVLYPHDATQVISGLVVCQDYPVGVIIPKKIIEYKPLFTIEEETKLSTDDIDNIFEGAKWWVEKLMERGVYVENLYTGNILVSPNNYSHVVLDKLDELCTCRMETKEYVEELAKRGKDLRETGYQQLESFKNSYHNNNSNNKHFI